MNSVNFASKNYRAAAWITQALIAASVVLALGAAVMAGKAGSLPQNISAIQQKLKEAEASECAAKLGGNDAFWRYADLIYARTRSNGKGFPVDNLVPLAREIGLDETRFKTCLDSGQMAARVAEASNPDAAAHDARGLPCCTLSLAGSQHTLLDTIARL